MKKNYFYYVVDPIAETIVGSFAAISEEMAMTIVEKAYQDEKLKVYKDSLEVYKANGLFEVCETYGEVVCSCDPFGSVVDIVDCKSADEVE